MFWIVINDGFFVFPETWSHRCYPLGISSPQVTMFFLKTLQHQRLIKGTWLAECCKWHWLTLSSLSNFLFHLIMFFFRGQAVCNSRSLLILLFLFFFQLPIESYSMLISLPWTQVRICDIAKLIKLLPRCQYRVLFVKWKKNMWQLKCKACCGLHVWIYLHFPMSKERWVLLCRLLWIYHALQLIHISVKTHCAIPEGMGTFWVCKIFRFEGTPSHYLQLY